MSPGLAPPQQARVAEGFDRVAPSYDAAWTDAPEGRCQRAAVWRAIDGLFRPGARVLDLGCGTGADAERLRAGGMRVHLVDASSAMLEAARRRLGPGAAVTFEQRALEDLDDLQERGPFDGALSNFGALNCVADLRAVAAPLARLLAPGAPAVLCLMGPACAWEVAWYGARGKPRTALRRLRGAEARLGGAPPFQVRYPRVAAIRDAFAPWFRMLGWRGVGLAVPPSCATLWARRHPALLGRLDRFDARAAGWPGLRGLADHRLFVLERRI